MAQAVLQSLQQSPRWQVVLRTSHPEAIRSTGRAPHQAQVLLGATACGRERKRCPGSCHSSWGGGHLVGRTETPVPLGSHTQRSPQRETRALTHLREVAGGPARLPAQGRPGDRNHKSESWALGEGAWRAAHHPARPEPRLFCQVASCLHPLPLPLPVFGLSLPYRPAPPGPQSPHTLSTPPQDPLPGRGECCYSHAVGSLEGVAPGP